jgi:hypothetical protein
MGKPSPQKACALKGHLDLPGPFQFGRHHEAPLQGFFLQTIPMALPRAASCLPLKKIPNLLQSLSSKVFETLKNQILGWF